MSIPHRRNLDFIGNEIVFGGRRRQLEYPIHQAVFADDLVVVVFEYMSVPPGVGNLVAYEQQGGQCKWVAETPGEGATSHYVEMTDVSDSQIKAYIFGSYDCVVDVQSGRLLSATFTK